MPANPKMTNFSDPSDEDIDLLFSFLRENCPEEQVENLEFLISDTDFGAFYSTHTSYIGKFCVTFPDSPLCSSTSFDEFFERLQQNSQKSEIVNFLIDEAMIVYMML